MSGIILVVIAVFASLYNQAIAPMGIRITEQSMEALTQMYGAAATTPSINIGVISNNIILISIRFVLPALFIVGALLNRQPVKAVPDGLAESGQEAEPYAPLYGTEPYAPVQEADYTQQAEEPYISQADNTFDTPQTEAGRDE